jgi:vacuolar-type H+-ATPase subunit E/Vma4
LTAPNLISVAQSDALLHEIARQLRDESRVMSESAEREARGLVAQARATARRRLHDAIAELRREGDRRLARARAQLETELRERAQRRAAKAINEAWPLLHEALTARWRDRESRKTWTSALAQLAKSRLRGGLWTVEHPDDWSTAEQHEFLTGLGSPDGIEVAFETNNDTQVGLVIRADHATLDATPRGLLADQRAVAAHLLSDIMRDAAT